MPSFAINHMTMARHSFAQLLDAAAALECRGVEVRDDLSGPPFDGLEPAEAGRMARDRRLELLAVAQVPRFDVCSDAMLDAARRLIDVAAGCSARGIVLVPDTDGASRGAGTRRAQLRTAVRELGPLLGAAGLVGLIEPLGFAGASLRHKADVLEALDAEGVRDRFKLVHDTFHHALAGGGPVYPLDTALVHVSGVTDAASPRAALTDASRGLVDGDDSLDTVGQLAALIDGGFDGPVSMEAFAPEVHDAPDLVDRLKDSYASIDAGLAAMAT